MENMASPWIWFGFSLFLIVALSIDTVFLHKQHSRSHESIRVALFWTFTWITCALIFNALLWFYLYETTDVVFANTKALEFLTGYVIEKTLSIDNLFAFYVVFEHFRIPAKYQQRVFTYGIWGAVIMRLGIILVGTWLISRFHWILYVMGAFLLFTGIKMFFTEEKEKDLAETFVLKIAKKIFRVTHEFVGEQFFVRKDKLLYVTPLFLALIFVEVSDLVFAIDSIPAIFAVTRDPFIVWTSNIFAILGLRALYFVLVRMLARFALLKYGIAIILAFIGAKMMFEPWIDIPIGLSLTVIASIIIIFMLVSVKYTDRQEK